MTQENFSRPKSGAFKISMKKGELGELFFREFLERRGWVVYQPKTIDRPHFCDIFATRGKREFLFADVKTKARLNNFDATGIDTSSYNDYLRFAKNSTIPFYLVFINDKDGAVHYCEITELERSESSFSISNGRIICWPMTVMHKLFDLTAEQTALLSTYDQRNYEYSPR